MPFDPHEFRILYEKTHLTRRGALEAAQASPEPGVLRVPDGIETLDIDFAYFLVREDLLPHIRKLIIPAGVKHIESMRGDPSIGPYGYPDNPFAEIVVEPGNRKFCSIDGVLFQKDAEGSPSVLLCYPCGRPDPEYEIPEGTRVIDYKAFLNAEHLERVYFPESLTLVEEKAFCACEKLDFPEQVSVRRLDDRYLVELHEPEHRGAEPVRVWYIGSFVRPAEQPAPEEWNRMTPVTGREKREFMDAFLWDAFLDTDLYMDFPDVQGRILAFGAKYYAVDD